ncbi:MAG: hypothetical protein JWM10_2505 [Myxococcaceae bacterium]|nr:hypothetical protein [Myxococcaceae bacterium]
MRRRPSFALLFPLLLGLAACSSDPSVPFDGDAGINPPSDLGAVVDAPAATDLGARSDVATVADVGNVTDAAPPRDGPLPGLGGLSGACGNLRAMLHSAAPSLVENGLVFMAGERYVRAALSPGGQRLFDTPNAGGSSTESEVFSYEVLHRCEDAALVATETEVMYQPANDAGANSITDLLVSIGGERVGVSVTRAYRPMPMVLTEANARDLLVTKLTGINRSSMRVLPAQRWVKQILHVFAVDMSAAQAVSRAWTTIDAGVRADTIVLVTLTRGAGFIYCNPDPALGSECPPI